MHADGFTLDQKRTPCAENDIPDAINRFQHLDAEANRTRKDQSFFVPVEEIRANDYDLTFNKYKEVERKVVEYVRRARNDPRTYQRLAAADNRRTK